MDSNCVDNERFTNTVNAYKDMVFRLAYSRTRNRFDADDVTQNVFLKLYRELGHESGIQLLSDEDHLLGWLVRVTLNECTTLHRQRKRKPASLEGDQTAPVYTLASQDRATQPQDALDDADRRKTVLDALLTLPEKYRVVLTLRYALELDSAQIAQALNIPESTVRTRLARGRKKLAAQLGYSTCPASPAQAAPTRANRSPVSSQRKATL